MLIEGLAGMPGLRLPVPDAHVGHAWYKFYAYVEPERLKTGWSRDRIMEEISDQGVPCMQGICPEVYLEKAFKGKGESGKVKKLNLMPEKRLAAARELGETSLMFFVHPTLGRKEMEATVRVVRGVMGQAA